MNSKIPQFLEEIISYFPEISPPVTLSEEVAVKFSSLNKPIPVSILTESFSRWDSFDEFTELIPCFQIPVDGQFIAIVWLKASLSGHEYVLATIDLDGTLISKKIIAGTLTDGNRVLRSVATIDEDNCVFTAIGESENNNLIYKPKNTMAYRFEILPDGVIQSKKEQINKWEEREEENQT